VRIGGRGFEVIGLQRRQGTAGGVSLDRYAWMPLATHERVFGAASTLQVFAASTVPGSTLAAEDRAHATMRARRHQRPGQPDVFDLITPEAARGFVGALSSRVGGAAVPISIMALLAAVVVVTNTTLVSVAQRTRDIGVRRALGATRAAVVLETLAESSIIALAGGALGLAGAVGPRRHRRGYERRAPGVSAATAARALPARPRAALSPGGIPHGARRRSTSSPPFGRTERRRRTGTRDERAPGPSRRTSSGLTERPRPSRRSASRRASPPTRCAPRPSARCSRCSASSSAS
jgi:hypothetical protein